MIISMNPKQKPDWRIGAIKLLVLVWMAIVLFMLFSCNTTKTTTTATSQSSDSSATSFYQHSEHSKADNLKIKRDNGQYRKVTFANNNISPINFEGYTVPAFGSLTIETGTFNKDKTVQSHKEESKKDNRSTSIKVAKKSTATTTVTTKSRFAWLPTFLLAIAGVGVVIATRIPLVVSLILALINFIISKFKKHKKQ